MLNPALLAVNIPFLVFAAASSAPSGPMLTRIDATKAVGMTIVASAKGLTLETLDGSVAKTFPCDGAHLKITSTKSQIWSLKDKRGAGLSITDKEPRYLVVVNRGYKVVTVTEIGTPIIPISVPIHALTIVNQVTRPLSITILDNHRTFTKTFVSQQITMVCPYVDVRGTIVSFNAGTFDAHTDFGLATKSAR